MVIQSSSRLLGPAAGAQQPSFAVYVVPASSHVSSAQSNETVDATTYLSIFLQGTLQDMLTISPVLWPCYFE